MSAKLHVGRTRAGTIQNRAHRAAALAEARREVAVEAQPVEDLSVDEQLDAACLELRGWARTCPSFSGDDIWSLLAECERGASENLLAVTVAELHELSLHATQQSELASLLSECEHAVLSRRERASAAPVDSGVLADTVSELQLLCGSRPGDAALASLMEECVTEADRRESLSRSVTIGEVVATETQIEQMVTQDTTHYDDHRGIDHLRTLQGECKRQIKRHNVVRRPQQRSPRNPRVPPHAF